MIKSVCVSVCFMAIGIIALINPKILKYLKYNYFDLYSFLNDYSSIKNLLGIVLIILPLLYIIHTIRKKQLYVLYSLNITHEPFAFPKYIKDKKCKELITTPINKVILNNALSQLYEFSEKIKNDENKSFYFCSICDIPFIVKLGYIIGDSVYNVSYLHYDREKCKYKLLKQGISTLQYTCFYDDNKAKELFVIIESSFNVDYSELNERFKKMNLLRLSTSPLNVNSIDNKNKLLSFADYSINKIREHSTKINKIHITIAASSSFAFAFGQRISNSMDKRIVVYNYVNSNKINNRPWGLEINCVNCNNECIVIDEKALDNKE